MTAPAPQPIDQGQALFDSRRTQCRNVMDRIDDAESRITKLKASIEDKKNRVYLQQSYRDKCQQFIQLQTEYRKLLHQNRVEPHPALEVGATNQGKILETSTTIAIKAVVDKLRNISERGILEGADPQPGDLADLHRLLENALQTAPPYIFLKSLDALVRLAAAKIKAQADELRNMQHENDADGRREAVQALLQQFREQHVAKFVETERLTNESAEVKKKAGKVLAEIDARLEEQFPKDPVQRQLNRCGTV
ncbi:hypothetical protein BC936DRAFT_139455 [Jimgerdemannia flammicorona]|uniref:Uncharacterized protein n=1 Tax=Jimgerdemannia flammicorona TaxID=994334 RepID=A0A433DHP5_9FUNG|nr:hypothetical protein BC936DRAFT_139455 [Jimgerdemannia flammicorona]